MGKATLHHLGAPKEKGKKALQEQLATLGDVLLRVANTDDVEVWDRSVIGESVYGPSYRAMVHNTMIGTSHTYTIVGVTRLS